MREGILIGGKEMPHYNVVGALVMREGKVLAARRGTSKFEYVAHKYEFVGGKVEPGETEEEALVRELREELCVSARVLRHFRTVDYVYPDFSVHLSVYSAEFLSEFHLTEHEELRWIPVAQLDPSEWSPADAPIVDALRRGEPI